MSSYTQILYQIVFSTKNRRNTLLEENRDHLFRYIWGILKNKKCHLYQIGGVENHLHIITHVHPMVAPALLVKDIKLGASDFIKNEGVFPGFEGWQDGYGAFTYSFEAKDRLISYVKNQIEHHKTVGFREEFIELLKEHQIEFDERFLF